MLLTPIVYQLHQALCKRPYGASSAREYYKLRSMESWPLPRVLRGRKSTDYRVAYTLRSYPIVRSSAETGL